MSFFAYYIGLILLWLTQVTGSLGAAIILFSILLKTLLLPISVSSQRQMERMRLLQPKINQLKEKHKDDTKAFQAAQAELMKIEKVNPIAGCLPQVIQLVVMFMLYRVFLDVFSKGVINGTTISTQFLWFDLATMDPYYIIPLLAGLSQFVLSYMMLPKKNPDEMVAAAASKKEKTDDFASMGESMQRQMVFILPVMTAFSLIMFKLPSGLGLYWVTITIFSIVQQYFMSGLGSAEGLVKNIPFFGPLLIAHQPAANVGTNAGNTQISQTTSSKGKAQSTKKSSQSSPNSASLEEFSRSLKMLGDTQQTKPSERKKKHTKKKGKV